ncbi:MAG: type III-A CRISPR-associated RAMP protein Csm4 [bacterium]
MENKTFDVIKLRFKAPLHISRGQTNSYDISEKIIHSDTLKAALFSMAKQILPEEVTGDAKRFHESYKVSSAFPFSGSNLFFPKPKVHLPVSIAKMDETEKAKPLKKVEYIEKAIFEKILNNTHTEIEKEQLAGQGKYMLSAPVNNSFKLTKSKVEQKVNIPQDRSNDTQPYYIDRIYFEKDAGLFFLFETENTKIKQHILSCLKLLGDEGIGTDRNVGNGLFDFEVENISFNLPDQFEKLINLSLYLPLKEELNENQLKQSAYELVRRGGYIAGTNDNEFLKLRKKQVFMMSEGSVFKSGTDRKGKIVNLKPEYDGVHDIWRDGTSIFLPLKAEL